MLSGAEESFKFPPALEDGLERAKGRVCSSSFTPQQAETPLWLFLCGLEAASLAGKTLGSRFTEQFVLKKIIYIFTQKSS